MPGLECEKLTYFDDTTNIMDLFGFFYCKIEAPVNRYLGLLPVRYNLGIIFPLGSWEGWYFSEELKFAKENGYNITVIKGYRFNRVKDVFLKYVEAIYNIKSNPKNKTQKAIAKSLLNNLLGRFGINRDKAITNVMSQVEFSRRSIRNKITSYKEISKDKLLVTYVPKLDYDVIKSHDLDFIKVSSKYNDLELQNMDNTSIVISAAVTAYARIHITKIKLDILSKGGKIFYSDTDSIVTDLELDEDMVNTKELGKLKLEHKVAKGIFITNKTYCLIDNNNNKFINKTKGINT
jgi:DNA polymerase type B, organellar and viral